MAKKATIVLSILGGLIIIGGGFWWIKKGRFIFGIPKLTILSVDKKNKVLKGKLGTKPFRYKYEKGMAINIPGKGVSMTIKEVAKYNPFPTNLGFTITKKGKIVATPTPF